MFPLRGSGNIKKKQMKGTTHVINFFVRFRIEYYFIFDSFLFLCSVKCLSPRISATRKKGLKKQIVLYWVSQNPLHFLLEWLTSCDLYPSPLRLQIDGNPGRPVPGARSSLPFYKLPTRQDIELYAFVFLISSFVDNFSLRTSVSFAYNIIKLLQFSINLSDEKACK